MGPADGQARVARSVGCAQYPPVPGASLAAAAQQDSPGMSDKPLGFVALRSLKKGPPDAAEALAEIRRIYFKTTKKTIEHDLTHAIELLKSMPSEEERDKAAVFMDGLSQMRSEWATQKPEGPPKKKKRKPRA
jgi:hypothetical protein